MIVFEDRATYAPGTDPVSTVTLTVECSPSHVASLTDFLVGVSAKAGVYSVAVDHILLMGEAHAERVPQPANLGPAQPEVGERSETAGAGEPGLVDARENGELAGAPRQRRTRAVGRGAKG